MNNRQAARRRFAAAFALVALVLTAAAMDGGNAARADITEPDYLVLNPENE